MKSLGDYFSGREIFRPGFFSVLGGKKSRTHGVLAYADTTAYLGILCQQPHITALFTRPDIAEMVPDHIGVVVTESPRNAFYQFHEKLIDLGFYDSPPRGSRGSDCRIHSSALVDESVTLGDRVVIGERVVIRGQVEIGSDTLIEAGVLIGVEGILYFRLPEGNRRIRHAGSVHIGSHVTILANAVVVRSVFPSVSTTIGDNSIIGVASNIGHEAELFENVVVSGNCVVARNSSLGAGSFLGTSAVVTENIIVGSGARVMAGSMVVKNVPANQVVS